MNATKSPSSAQVYVSTYSTYNGGSLKGLWIDLTEFENCSDFFKHLSKLNKTIWKEADPEFMFQDYECFPSTYYWEGGMKEEIFQFIHEVDDNDKDDFTEFLENWEYDSFDEQLEQFNSRRTGYEKFDDMAYDYACDTFSKEFIDSGYFDFKKYEKELEWSYTKIGEMIYSNQ